MSSKPIHAPMPSSSRGVIRYSLFVLVSATAIALALDSGYNFLRMVRIINERIVFQGETFDFFGWKPWYTVTLSGLRP
jgi:hypothetical protein